MLSNLESSPPFFRQNFSDQKFLSEESVVTAATSNKFGTDQPSSEAIVGSPQQDNKSVELETQSSAHHIESRVRRKGSLPFYRWGARRIL
jgi:hypothetical protein